MNWVTRHSSMKFESHQRFYPSSNWRCRFFRYVVGERRPRVFLKKIRQVEPLTASCKARTCVGVQGYHQFASELEKITTGGQYAIEDWKGWNKTAADVFRSTAGSVNSSAYCWWTTEVNTRLANDIRLIGNWNKQVHRTSTWRKTYTT